MTMRRGERMIAGRQLRVADQIDPRGFTFSKVEVLKCIALPEDERYRQTLLEWEQPRCCQCPFHCPPHGSGQLEHPYAARFRRRSWNR
jgi:hypothetical protein